MSKENKKDLDPKVDTKALNKLPVRKIDGSPTGEQLDLDPRLFGLPRNDHVLYLAVKAEMTNQRQGTNSTKTRSEVRGGGRKPFRQKGRGAARAGTTRSPIWRSGGITFGPQPIDYSMKLPAKVKKLARKVAFSVKAQSGSIELLDDLTLDTPKTQTIANLLHNFEANGRSALLLTDKHDPVVVKSCRNIPRLVVRYCLNASTYDLLKARKVIICRSAVDSLVGGLVDEK